MNSFAIRLIKLEYLLIMYIWNISGVIVYDQMLYVIVVQNVMIRGSSYKLL